MNIEEQEKKKKGKKKKKKKRKKEQIGTSKAVDTMFRNAYRAELDIIALAATKVNIMISLNGFIISALVISGAFVFSSSLEFLVPAAVFLVTAAISIIFALLAASPEQVDLFSALWKWGKAVSQREAKWSDFRHYLARGQELEVDNDFNLLIYSDRSRLDKETYWAHMEVFLRDRDGVYKKMGEQLYWLGLMANRKFSLLNVSYTVFRWGVLASVVLFLGMKSAFTLFPTLAGEETVQFYNLGISELEGIYEPSAVQQLPDGRLLVVEDEASRAINVMTIANDGSLVNDSVGNVQLMRDFGRRLNDLEGLSIDDNGYIYAITSHSANKTGERLPEREQLLRFQIDKSDVKNISSFTSLTESLQNAAELKRAILEQSGVEINFRTLNVEGLAYYKQAEQLLLGLRDPKADTFSIIIVIENPADVFNNQASPQFGDPILLDLQGGGIRALSYDPVLDSFLIVNEIDDGTGKRTSQLWSWSGRAADDPQPVALPDIINLDNVESIDSIMFYDEPRLLLMSDEGNAQTDRPAKYMMLDYSQLGRFQE